MSTDDVVSEARALLALIRETEAAAEVALEADGDDDPESVYAVLRDRNAAHNALDTHAPRIVADLLALVDDQRARLDALAPLAEAAGEHELTVRRLADAQARVVRLEEVVTAHVGEVRRQCARIEELEEELARRPPTLLAFARGER